MDNPPAFPMPASEHSQGGHFEQYGMSLHDWFAGQALRLELLDQEFVTYMGYRGAEITDAWAKRAYDIADAMLAEREKRNA